MASVLYVCVVSVSLHLHWCLVGADASPNFCLHGASGECRYFTHLLKKEESNAGRAGADYVALADIGDPVTTTTHRGEVVENGTAASATGLTTNAEGDLTIFLTGVGIYASGSLFCVAFFMVAKEYYPAIYQNNIVKGIAPKEALQSGKIPPGILGWARAALGTSTEATEEAVGMDVAMLLQYTNFCIKLLAIIGGPMLFIMGPMHLLFGGNYAGPDHLSYLSFGNVENGSWLYWVHAFVVWGVVITVRVSVYREMKNFTARRQKWLQLMPDVRAFTVLVEAIPESPDNYRSDKELKKFFADMFGKDNIEDAYVVKDTTKLLKSIAERDSHQLQANKSGKHITDKEKDDYKVSIDEERKQVNDLSEKVGGVNQAAGFVEFKSRAVAEMALSVQYTDNREEFVVSHPPDAESIRWADLNQSEEFAEALTWVGYGLVAGLYLAYLPAVLGITQIANSINMGPLQSAWASVAPTMGLQVMVAFLPTFLIWIFKIFFTLRADVYAQERLQNWYFWFQVVFVLMVTSIGSNAWDFTLTLLSDPFSVPELLADTMPYATHFYMNLLVMTWFSHAMNLTRYINLMKFMGLSKIYPPGPNDDTAREMSEPEDQDYYGMGSRSARFSINLAIPIVFGTLSPPIMGLAFINFCVCRLVYGYLIPFAESKKPDTGGFFFVLQLRHVFVFLGLYAVMMTGVLYGRAATSGPAWIAGGTIFFVAYSALRFEKSFEWEKLPFKALHDPLGEQKKRKQQELYKQKELYTDEQWEEMKKKL